MARVVGKSGFPDMGHYELAGNVGVQKKDRKYWREIIGTARSGGKLRFLEIRLSISLEMSVSRNGTALAGGNRWYPDTGLR